MIRYKWRGQRVNFLLCDLLPANDFRRDLLPGVFARAWIYVLLCFSSHEIITLNFQLLCSEFKHAVSVKIIQRVWGQLIAQCRMDGVSVLLLCKWNARRIDEPELAVGINFCGSIWCDEGAQREICPSLLHLISKRHPLQHSQSLTRR